MNLIIDIGNSLTKLAVYNKNKEIKRWFVKSFNKNILNEISNNFSIKSSILSSVVEIDKNLYELLVNDYGLIIWSAQNLPIKIDYKTEKTLGTDRIAASIGGYIGNKKKDILIIQTGTCLTYDIVNSDAVYFGGAISPGIDMRFKALHTFTNKLPLVSYKNIDFIIGKSTNEAILSGVINGIITEVDGMIDDFKRQLNKDLLVIITGGYADFFANKLKNSNFADPNLVMKGLNEIISFYAHTKKNT